VSAYRPDDVGWMSRYYRALVSGRDDEALECLQACGLSRRQGLELIREDIQSETVSRRRKTMQKLRVAA